MEQDRHRSKIDSTLILNAVQVTGNVKSGFLAEFLPEEVGPHIISVEYNNIPVGGTPFTGKNWFYDKQARQGRPKQYVLILQILD